jgi:serine/threonine protein kinase
VASLALKDGDLIDSKYRIVRFLGRGAWASVYEGVNARIGRRVAIKVLGHDTLEKPGVVERFEREAQAATRIDSEHVVHVFDLGTLSDGRPYIVMELLEGEDFAHVLVKQGPLKEQKAVFYVVQALRGLADAHSAGIMHRDIKPDNVFLVTTKHGDEIVKIVDFGISKLHSGAQVTSMTQTNAVLGSPVYMSPEQCRGAKHMDHRSDLYSLGVVLFEALTGHLPHHADTFNELMFKIALEDVPSPTSFRPELDSDLCMIVAKALAREPANRYQSAVEFENALIAWADAKGLEPDSWFQSRHKRRPSRVDDSQKYSVTSSGSMPRALSGSEDPRDPLRRSDSAAHRIGSPEAANNPAFATAQTMEVVGGLKGTSRGVVIAMAGALVALLGVVLYLGVFKKSAPATLPLPVASVVTPPPSAVILSTAEPVPTQTAAATASTPVEVDAPKTDTTAKPVASAGGHRQPSGKPSASAVASASGVPSASAAPAPSTKSVIDGRTFRTNF